MTARTKPTAKSQDQPIGASPFGTQLFCEQCEDDSPNEERQIFGALIKDELQKPVDKSAHVHAHLRQKRKVPRRGVIVELPRSEEHTSELQSLMRISYAVFCL